MQQSSNHCKNIWTYKGSNDYCANCSRCKSTVFIKNLSLILEQNKLRDDHGRTGDRKIIESSSFVSGK